MATETIKGTHAPAGARIIEQSGQFFDWLATWYDNLPAIPFEEALPDPKRGAILVEDLLIGFCREGPLSSARIDAVVPPTVALMRRAHDAGVCRFVISRDAHEENAPEFSAYPPHCIKGTPESEIVPEILELPFADDFTIIEKNSLSTGICTAFEDWLSSNRDLTEFIVTGDCTDLCTYSLAMHIRMWLNAANLAGRRVIVDASTVQTYDVPVSAANGAMPHPGDFLHMLFLYHMALNGIEVVAAIT